MTARKRWSCIGLILLIALVFFVAVPARATVFSLFYSKTNANVESPTVTLGTGDAGSSALSSVAPNAASGTVTAGLTYYSQATSSSVSQLAIRGSGTKGSTSASSITTGTFSITTGDLVYVIVAIANVASQTVTGVADSLGSTYHPRRSATEGTLARVETWYAIAAGTSTTASVTATLSAAARVTIIAMSVRGVNAASPFDPSSSSVATGTGTSATLASATISTAYTNDMLLGALAIDSSATTTADTGDGFAQRTSVASGTLLRASAEDVIVTNQESNLSPSYTWGTNSDWAFVADAVVSGFSPPTADTSLTPPGGTGNAAVAAGRSLYLWSPAYTSTATLYSGSWLLDLWAKSATAGGTVSISAWIVNSTGGIVAQVTPTPVTTGAIGTAKGEVLTTVAGQGAAIPANGMIMVALTTPSGGPTITVYYGTAQLTNFQTPAAYDYVFTITSPAGGSWSTSLAVASSTSVSRLTNMTVTLKVPDAPTFSVYSEQVAVLGGAITQSSGPTVALAASTTMYVYVYATASSVGTSSFSFALTLYPPTGTAYTEYTIDLTVS